LKPGKKYVYRVAEALEEGEVREAEEWTLRIETLPETEFASAEDFFTHFLSPVFSRELTQAGGAQWCLQWWRHPEASRVVEAIWWSYEAQRPAQPPEFPTKSRADWFAYHAYPLMDRLLVGTGTFRQCETTNDVDHQLLEPLPQVINPTA
jgi:hypothetical protein